MITRRRLLIAASSALGVTLIIIFVEAAKTDLSLTLKQLQGVRLADFTKVVALTACHIYLSNWKWRAVDAALRCPTDSAPSQLLSFVLTTAGVTLGLLLPVQLTTTSTRTLGTYVHGRAIRRGTTGTLFEQSFDVLVAGFVVLASAMAKVYGGGQMLWSAMAIIALVASVLCVSPLFRTARWLVAAIGAKPMPTTPWRRAALRWLSAIGCSGFLDVALARNLALLSAIRFMVQIAMAWQVAQAVHLTIPIWHLAAATPLVTLACALIITPGAMGVSELGYTTALNLFGTPLIVGGQWALANRFLITASCLVILALAAIALALRRFTSTSRLEAVEGR